MSGPLGDDCWRDAGGETEERSAGDYLLWAELLEYAQSVVDDGRPFLLVTNDVKDDWYAKSGGEPTGPRPELVREFYACNSNGYHQVTLDGMLRLARTHLSVDIGDATIEKASELSRPDLFYVDESSGLRHATVVERRPDQTRSRAALDREESLELLVDLLREESLAGLPDIEARALGRTRLMLDLAREVHEFSAAWSSSSWSEAELRSQARWALQNVVRRSLPSHHVWTDMLEVDAVAMFLDVVRSYRRFEMPHLDEDRGRPRTHQPRW